MKEFKQKERMEQYAFAGIEEGKKRSVIRLKPSDFKLMKEACKKYKINQSEFARVSIIRS